MKREDIIIYACVIMAAGVGLMLNQALPGVFRSSWPSIRDRRPRGSCVL